MIVGSRPAKMEALFKEARRRDSSDGVFLFFLLFFLKKKDPRGTLVV